MRKLQKLIAAERTNFSPYSSLSPKAISRIASKCRKDEVADAHILIKECMAELATVPDWDGDTHDDIWRSIELFRAILQKVR
ncbi:hypothetical protein [Enterobacter asburiae]|uniref:hypothetical protein n=1 Tax=Enterobacter asburiae TaxID=61645 RepID=UPI0018C29322|nr:hypothetical protein [Enterobacter asburiae]MBF9769653.1 hypothetical protein [Enterobacter asburiae]